MSFSYLIDRHCEEPAEAIQDFATSSGLLRGACHRDGHFAPDPLARNDDRRFSHGVKAPLVLRHRLAMVDRLVVRLGIGIVTPMREAAVQPAIVLRQLVHAAIPVNHLRLVIGRLGADLCLRHVSLRGWGLSRRRLGLR